MTKDIFPIIVEFIEPDDVEFIEGEVMYSNKGEVPEEEYLLPIGVSEVKRAGTDVTVVAWSKMLFVAEKAAAQLAQEGIEVEIVDPRTIRPLDSDTIVASVKKTKRCVVLNEHWPYGGVGAEIVDRVQRQAFDYLDAPIGRVSGADVPMPYAENLERAALPNADMLIAAIKETLYLA